MGNCFDNKKVEPEFYGIHHIESSCVICYLNDLKIDFIENHPTKYKVSEIREVSV